MLDYEQSFWQRMFHQVAKWRSIIERREECLGVGVLVLQVDLS
jgi:hypothetical protein